MDGAQLLEAFPWDQTPRYLLRDRDRCYADKFSDTAKWMGIREVLTAPQSPWQNAYAERFIGSIRRECLDHVIVFDETGLRRVLKDYFAYYERCRTIVKFQEKTAMKIVGALLLAVTLFACMAFAQDKKDYPLQVQMGDITERTWAAMSYSWWASATINGVTYDAKCEAALCSHALVAGTYAARLEGDNLYVYGETSDGKAKVVRFKLKRGKTAHGTMHPASN